MLFLNISDSNFFHFYFSDEYTSDLYIESLESLHKFIFACLAQKKNCVFTRTKLADYRLRTDKHTHFEDDFCIINFSIKNKFRHKLKDSNISSFDILMSCLKNHP